MVSWVCWVVNMSQDNSRVRIDDILQKTGHYEIVFTGMNVILAVMSEYPEYKNESLLASMEEYLKKLKDDKNDE